MNRARFRSSARLQQASPRTIHRPDSRGGVISRSLNPGSGDRDRTGMASLEGPGIRSPIDVDVTMMTPSAQVGQCRIPFGCRRFRHMGRARWGTRARDGVLVGELCSAIQVPPHPCGNNLRSVTRPPLLASLVTALPRPGTRNNSVGSPSTRTEGIARQRASTVRFEETPATQVRIRRICSSPPRDVARVDAAYLLPHEAHFVPELYSLAVRRCVRPGAAGAASKDSSVPVGASSPRDTCTDTLRHAHDARAS